ncbi:response regulator transcription factor [Sphingomonas cannabina]|uniref:response regulator transcription factor n=1 Tax=Sphingomonas cannabina TaxID=2899123 RepID=UPI001F251E3F|nr:response regulator transcription factor [Sphingomonas cannabina]UIJ44819.1 response regulator transcription factor [Sphingomonas cannabina]
MRVIILEENVAACRPLQSRLEREGFGVASAGSAFEFYRSIAIDDYDIAIIGGVSSEPAGLEIASWLRRKGDIGIILITAGNKVQDYIRAFEIGVDLPLAAPLTDDELVEGVHSLARRIARRGGPAPTPALPASEWYFDPAYWILHAPTGAMVKLTALETKLIERLLLRSGTLIPRNELRAELGYSADPAGDRSLDAIVQRLRHKIERATGLPAPVKTVHGQGHLFSAPLLPDRRRAANR